MTPARVLIWLAVPLLTAGCTSREIQTRLDNYQPPSYTRMAPLASPPTPPPADDEAYAAAKKRVSEAEQSWEAAITGQSPGLEFYPTHPAAPPRMATVAAPLQDPFTLVELEQTVLSRNPGIRAAQSRFRAALQAYPQISAVDDILRRYTTFTEALMNPVGPMSGMEGAGFPFPGILALKGKMADQQAIVAWETYQLTIRTQLTRARELFWQLSFNQEASRINHEMLTLFQRLESVAKTRYEAGQTNFQEVIRIRIRKETLGEELRTLQAQQASLAESIRQLADLPPLTQLGRPATENHGPEIFALTRLQELALNRRQEIRIMRARIAKLATMLELAETMILPSFDLGFSRFRDSAANQVGSNAMQPAFTAVLPADRGAGLPKQPWLGSQNAYLNETRLQLTGLQAELLDLENSTRALVQAKWVELDRARREFRLYNDTVIGLAKTALDVASRGYESGKIAFADVIASHANWLEANLSRARKHSETGTNLAQLDALTGVAGSIPSTPGDPRP